MASIKLIFFTVMVASLGTFLVPDAVHGSPIESFGSGDRRMSRKARNAKPPPVPTAPLDPNENIHHTIDEVNSILGTLGGASSQAVFGLTGVSITDCALTIKEEDLTTITCAEFIDKLSECDSLAHLKPLLQQAKQKYRKNPNSRAPCFARKAKRHG